jgi:hypothetical protein
LRSTSASPSRARNFKAYDPYVVDAKEILERVTRLREEMQEIQDLNTLYEHSSHEGIKAYEKRRDRLREIREELARTLDQLRRTGTN